MTSTCPDEFWGSQNVAVWVYMFDFFGQLNLAAPVLQIPGSNLNLYKLMPTNFMDFRHFNECRDGSIGTECIDWKDSHF